MTSAVTILWNYLDLTDLLLEHNFLYQLLQILMIVHLHVLY